MEPVLVGGYIIQNKDGQVHVIPHSKHLNPNKLSERLEDINNDESVNCVYCNNLNSHLLRLLNNKTLLLDDYSQMKHISGYLSDESSGPCCIVYHGNKPSYDISIVNNINPGISYLYLPIVSGLDKLTNLKGIGINGDVYYSGNKDRLNDIETFRLNNPNIKVVPYFSSLNQAEYVRSKYNLESALFSDYTF